MSSRSAAIFGVFLCIGLSILGYQLADAAIRYKQFERTVVVKGLSERDYPADTVIWPIKFAVASDDMSLIYSTLDRNNDLIKRFEENYEVRDKQDVLAMCALQFAAQVEQKAIHKEYIDEEVKEKLVALDKLLKTHI